MRAAVYLRQSEDRDDTKLAVDRQREDCLKLVESKGWDPVEYLDNATSASKGVREAYQQMLADIRENRIDAVVAWDLDRLHRQPIELEEFIQLAEQKRLALATVGGEADLSTDGGRLFARIKGAVARSEIERKSARQRRQARQQAENGGGWGGRRAFGYTQPDNAIRPDEAKLIRKAYGAILAGASLYSVAAQWNEAGATTTVGKEWSGSTVGQLLKNPRYKGRRAYKGEEIADAKWDAIVKPDVWQSVYGILTDPSRRRGGGTRSRLLTGILECGQCGAPMGSGKANTDGAAIYVCKKCHRLSRRLEPIDTLVTKLVVAYLSRPDSLKVLTVDDGQDAKQLMETERALLAQQEQLAADRYDPDVSLTAAQYKAANDRLTARLADVRKGMRDSHRVRVFDGLENAVAKGAVREWWDGLGLDRQRAIIPILLHVKLKPMGRGRPFDRSHLDLQWVTGDD
ncbi:recombinase family protein [soil metagenome]